MSNSPTRRSAVRRSMRPQSPRPRRPTLSSQDRLGVNAAELVPRFRSSRYTSAHSDTNFGNQGALTTL
jgi:hypothetical protein